jgi:hypothetical protein
MLSEHNSFPINPSLSTIENCLENVRNHADVLILVCGGRYGSRTDSGKSVTHCEYLEAREKRIPIYAFVEAQTLGLLPLWQQDRTISLAPVVDSPRLMEFIEQLHNGGAQWVTRFEKASQIQEALRTQLAILFGQALDYRKKFEDVRGQQFGDLDGEALRLVVDKPDGWEHLLFSSVARAQIAGHQELRYNLRHALGSGTAVRLRPNELREWMISKAEEFGRLIELGNRIVRFAFPEAMGKPGNHGDPVLVIRVAKQIALLHKRILHWSLEYQDLTLGEEFESLMSHASKCAIATLDEIESFVDSIQSEMENQLSRTEEERAAISPPQCTLSFALSNQHLDAVVAEFRRLGQEGLLA